jgi:hypothetical protein
VVLHRSDVVISPSLRYAAHVTEAGELRVYRAGETRTSPDDPSSPLPVATALGCSKLLAWSPQGNELACLYTADETGTLHMFSFAEATGVLSVATRVEGNYTYTNSEASLRRRAFSPAGRWFAFTTDAGLYLAEVSASRATVERPAVPLLYVGNPTAALDFSPDETQLLHHQGVGLWLRTLESGEAESVSLSTGLPATLPCSEIGSAPGTSFCGSSGEIGNLAWSPDAKAAAYRVLEGPPIRVASAASLRSVACGPGCAAFAFQPSSIAPQGQNQIPSKR